MTLLTMGMAAPTEQLSSRDMIQELWAHARYHQNSGILFPSMQFRASESFFQLNTLYFSCLSMILLLITLIYLCLQKKRGGRTMMIVILKQLVAYSLTKTKIQNPRTA